MARLTVRNVGSLVSLLNADTSCGFSSPTVMGAAVMDGAPGSVGTLTFTASACTIDLGESTASGPDCNGNAGSAGGKVTLSGTRVITGVLTGNATNPIIPSNADSVSIAITATDFDNFVVHGESQLTMVSGGLSAVIKPRLAVSASTGACAISTPNVAFESIVYEPSVVRVKTPTNDFEADVDSGTLTAQNGQGPSQVNQISGNLVVFGSAVPISGDLDPDYDAAAFFSGYSCANDLASPQSFACADSRLRMADGAARLSAQMLGTITSLLDANTTCGFSSAGVQGAAAFTGTPGDTGTLTLTVTDCELTYDPALTLPLGCTGTSATVVEGSVTVSGTKVVSGRFTGNPASPIVPLTDQPAQVTLDITVGAAGFGISSTGDTNALHAYSGKLSGSTQPRVFIGADTGLCSVTSSHADIGIGWSEATLRLTSGSNAFVLAGVSADLVAVNGTTELGTNELSGTFKIGATEFAVPSDGAGLNPAFDAVAFDAGWQCNPALAMPASSECGTAVFQTLAGGTAALTMRTLGTVMSLVNADSTCGFSSAPVVMAPAFAGGGLGDDGVTATFTLQGGGCTITLPADSPIGTDCLGNTSSAGGEVTVTGTKTVTGWNASVTNPAEFIVPSSMKPAVFDLSVTFNGFVAGHSLSPAPRLVVNDGSLSGKVSPRTAMDPTTGACSIGTPNVTFSDVTWTDANATLVSNFNAFNVAVATSALAAQAGSDGVETNTLTGDITVDGIPLAGLDVALDPAFDEAAFNSGYVCAANGNPILVPDAACSFRQVLGGAAARLLTGAVSLATSVASDACLATLTPTGTPNTPGSGTATAADCVVSMPTNFINKPDCTGGTIVGGGDFTFSGTKSINPAFLYDPDTNGTIDAFIPLAHDAVSFSGASFAMGGWRLEKQISGVPVAAISVTGATAYTGLTPILAEADENPADGTGDGQYTKSTPIFQAGGLSAGTSSAQLVLQGKTFNVTLSDLALDAMVGAFGGSANTINGSLSVNGEPVVITAQPYDSAFSQVDLDASYTCDPTVFGPVPAN